MLASVELSLVCPRVKLTSSSPILSPIIRWCNSLELTLILPRCTLGPNLSLQILLKLLGIVMFSHNLALKWGGNLRDFLISYRMWTCVVSSLWAIWKWNRVWKYSSHRVTLPIRINPIYPQGDFAQCRQHFPSNHNPFFSSTQGLDCIWPPLSPGEYPCLGPFSKLQEMSALPAPLNLVMGQ